MSEGKTTGELKESLPALEATVQELESQASRLERLASENEIFRDRKAGLYRALFGLLRAHSRPELAPLVKMRNLALQTELENLPVLKPAAD